MNTFSLCAAATVASVAAVILKKHNADFALIISVCSVTVIFTYVLGHLIDLSRAVDEIFSLSKINKDYLIIMFKSVGICMVTEFTCDTCKDAGQAALSTAVLFAGRIAVLTVSLPMFYELIKIIVSLCGG